MKQLARLVLAILFLFFSVWSLGGPHPFDFNDDDLSLGNPTQHIEAGPAPIPRRVLSAVLQSQLSSETSGVSVRVEPNLPPTSPFTVIGWVIEEGDSNRAIEGASVQCFFELDSGEFYDLGRTRTNGDGEYALKTDLYQRLSPAVIETGTIHYFADAKGYIRSGDEDSIADVHCVDSCSISLKRGSGGYGRVIDGSRKVVRSGTVAARFYDRAHEPEFSAYHDTVIYPDGRFYVRKDDDEKSEETVCLDLGSESGFLRRPNVALLSGLVRDLGEFQLGKQGQIRGRVVFRSGKPVAGIHLEASEFSDDLTEEEIAVPGLESTSTTTAKDGTFRLVGLKKGVPYQIYSSKNLNSGKLYYSSDRKVELEYLGRLLKVQILDENDKPIRYAEAEVSRGFNPQSGRRSIEPFETTDVTHPQAICYFDLPLEGKFFVTVRLEETQETRVYERAVPHGGNEATSIVFRIPRLETARSLKLKVDQPIEAGTAYFSATLVSPRTGQYAQSLEFDRDGVAPVFVSTGIWELVVHSSNDEAQPSKSEFVVVERRPIVIPRSGMVSAKIRLQMGGRLAVIAQYANLQLKASSSKPRVIALDTGQAYDVEFRCSNGCSVYMTDRLGKGYYGGFTALPAGRYQLAIDHPQLKPIKKKFQIKTGQETELNLVYQSRGS